MVKSLTAGQRQNPLSKMDNNAQPLLPQMRQGNKKMTKCVSCHLCGSNNVKEITTRRDRSTVIKCIECGVYMVDSMPKPSDLPGSFNETYFTKGEGFLTNYFNLRQSEFEKGEDTQHLLYLADIKRHKGGKRLLDVGCAGGFFLALAKKKGYLTYGIDISKFAIDYAKKTLGLKNVKAGTLEEAKFKSGFFDVVTMYGLMELVPDPLGTLKETNRILKNGGLLCLTTLNVKNSLFYGGRWNGFKDYVVYLHFFSPKTITKLLNKAGFEVVEVKTSLVIRGIDFLYRRIRKTRNAVLENYHKGQNIAGLKLRILRAIFRIFNKINPLEVILSRMGYGYYMTVYARKKAIKE